jgi:hypothetical protein
MHIPYSLSDTGRTQYSGLGEPNSNSTAQIFGNTSPGTGGFCNRIPSNPYLKLPTNPYNAPHGSFIFLCESRLGFGGDSAKTILLIGTLATATGTSGGNFYSLREDDYYFVVPISGIDVTENDAIKQVFEIQGSGKYLKEVIKPARFQVQADQDNIITLCSGEKGKISLKDN